MPGRSHSTCYLLDKTRGFTIGPCELHINTFAVEGFRRPPQFGRRVLQKHQALGGEGVVTRHAMSSFLGTSKETAVRTMREQTALSMTKQDMQDPNQTARVEAGFEKKFTLVCRGRAANGS